MICSINSSISLSIFLSLLYVSSSIALWISNLPWLVKILLLIILLYDYLRNLKLEGLRNQPNSIIAVWYNEKYWSVLTLKQRRFKANLGTYCYRSNILLILHLKGRRINKKILITKDSVSEEEYRYLSAGIHSLGKV